MLFPPAPTFIFRSFYRSISLFLVGFFSHHIKSLSTSSHFNPLESTSLINTLGFHVKHFKFRERFTSRFQKRFYQTLEKTLLLNHMLTNLLAEESPTHTLLLENSPRHALTLDTQERFQNSLQILSVHHIFLRKKIEINCYDILQNILNLFQNELEEMRVRVKYFGEPVILQVDSALLEHLIYMIMHKILGRYMPKGKVAIFSKKTSDMAYFSFYDHGYDTENSEMILNASSRDIFFFSTNNLQELVRSYGWSLAFERAKSKPFLNLTTLSIPLKETSLSHKVFFNDN